MITVQRIKQLLAEKNTNGTDGYRLIHYAKSPLQSVSTNYHGTGIADAADKRLRNDGEANSPISKRAYFYTQHKNGNIPKPEAGLGPHVHEADPSSMKLFDHTTASPEEKAALRATHNDIVAKKGVSAGTAHELALHQHGYDGYVNHEARMAVVMGDGKNIPVRHLGHQSEFNIEDRN